MMLIEGFPMMAYASVIEPFRAANVLSGADLYRWTHVGELGQAVRASNGIQILPDASVSPVLRFDTLFVCAGGNPLSRISPKLIEWLQRQAAHGARIGGISAGPFILARAGLLDGYSSTVHWEHSAAFIEAFPRVNVQAGLFLVDRNRLSCAGGTAGLDLSLSLIEAEHGPELARDISEWYIRTQLRDASASQRGSLRDRYKTSNGKVLAALDRMEGEIESPLSLAELSDGLGISSRQLERLFKEHLGTSVGRQYRAIRLDHARTLLRETGLPVSEVALASGFAGASHFSRVFSTAFGYGPSAYRRGDRA
jgi:transcriptional regulator GlxA family with amidase domain